MSFSCTNFYVIYGSIVFLIVWVNAIASVGHFVWRARLAKCLPCMVKQSGYKIDNLKIRHNSILYSNVSDVYVYIYIYIL